MRISVKLICLLLALCAVSTLLVACGGEENTSEASSTPADQTVSEDESFRLEKKDFGGVVIKAATLKNYDFQACEIAPLKLTAEPVNDAAYNRMTLIEQEYGIKLEQIGFDEQTDLVDTVREMVTTGTDEYQIVCAPLHYVAQLSRDDMYYDLASTESNDYIDLGQPYWDQSTVEHLSFNGKTYFLNGDAIVSDDEATWAVFFNKDIAEDNHLAEAYDAADMYELVTKGKWTIDVMYEMAKKVTTDLGDSGMTWDVNTQDIWGISAQLYDAYAFTVAAGETMTRLEDGLPIITAGDESNINAYDKVHNIFADTAYCALAETNGAASATKYDDIVQIFANGNALFTPEKIGTVSNIVMKEADIRYGILPMPKLNEAQDSYYSTITVWWCSALAIPVSNIEKFDATCYALEALAYYGQEALTPEYYDRTLKYKRFPDDEEAAEMLDIIFRNRLYDIGIVLNFGTDWRDEMLYFYPEILRSGTNTHISSLDSFRDSWQNAIDEFIETLT
ncbi:MAG: hypothetical protein IJD82_02030 [Clostridia bacterium]|nr:hypothetical protein [Clostridia bacterium]